MAGIEEKARVVIIGKEEKLEDVKILFKKRGFKVEFHEAERWTDLLRKLPDLKIILIDAVDQLARKNRQAWDDLNEWFLGTERLIIVWLIKDDDRTLLRQIERHANSHIIVNQYSAPLENVIAQLPEMVEEGG